MKLLVIGIDGGTKRIIDNMPMPFTQKLFAQSHSRSLKEDLISRGWAEILTGQSAPDNKSYYQMPIEKFKYCFSMSYTQSDMLDYASNDVLWKRLNKSSISVGLLNIPTTGPVEKVNGFIVAGGGGGRSNGSISSGMVYPPSYSRLLNDDGYIFDIRGPGSIKTVSEYVEKINHAQNVQHNAFIKLSLREKPDFGFHCFRITTVVQYLACNEIERCIQLIRESQKRGVSLKLKNSLQEKLVQHYVELDKNIQNIFEKLRPESYLFLGDHSTVPFEYDVNIDVWLEREGYLKKMTTLESRWDKLLFKIMKRKRKFGAALGIANKLPAYRRPATKFHPKKSKAFGTFYDTGNFAGIFINDKDRFSGPVETVEEIERLTDEICSRLNSTDFAREHELHAKPYRRLYGGSKFQRLMPDIKIEKPDTIYFSGRKRRLIEKNPNLEPLKDDLHGVAYPHTGLKGSNPLFVYSPDMEQYIEDSDPKDLRLAYRMICRYFQA
jgi:predicted AlkP superfamily phosphohydrolase/phosphomutase